MKKVYEGQLGVFVNHILGIHVVGGVIVRAGGLAAEGLLDAPTPVVVTDKGEDDFLLCAIAIAYAQKCVGHVVGIVEFDVFDFHTFHSILLFFYTVVLVLEGQHNLLSIGHGGAVARLHGLGVGFIVAVHAEHVEGDYGCVRKSCAQFFIPA